MKMTIYYEDFLKYYKDTMCNDLMYQHPNTIKEITKYLKEGIAEYAVSNSEIYKDYSNDRIYTREDFSVKNKWISSNFPENMIISKSTSGSTTGQPFSYFANRQYYEWLQNNCEFDLILKEYEIFNKPIKLLCLLKYPGNPVVTDFSKTIENYSKNQFHCYNAKNCSTTFIDFESYMDNNEEWHKKLLELLSQQTFDIVLSSGPIINRLVRHIRKNNFTKNFAYLLSHTTEFPIVNDFRFLQENGNIKYYCDHMKCWDGGAGFFTCKFGTHHLLDNFSWISQGEGNKLISTDYFNLASPFINYWNGDLCEIRDEYKKCKCGRYYRPFKMLENRPFALKGTTKLTQIKEEINQLDFKNNLVQVQFENLNVRISSDRELEKNEKTQLKKILKEYQITFC